MLVVGEFTPCCCKDGEKVWALELPPPPLPPPPPPWDAVVDTVAEDAECELDEGVIALDLGDKSDWPDVAC